MPRAHVVIRYLAEPLRCRVPDHAKARPLRAVVGTPRFTQAICEERDVADERQDTTTVETVRVFEAPSGVAAFKGRRRIFADCEEVTAANVVDVLNAAIPYHGSNAGQIQYLWDYYRGQQPILKRIKEVRPEICNRTVENHAQEVVAFKVGYQLAEPMQYVLRHHDGSTGPLAGETGEDEGGRDAHLGEINELNTLMFACDKASCDRDLFEWMCVCGVGYRMVEVSDGGDAPFALHVLDPRCTFVVRSSAYHHRALMGVWVTRDSVTASRTYHCFTPDALYRVTDGQLEGVVPHTYGAIPIVEYQLNTARMGVFEPVLPLLDAINAVEANRLDGIEQTVQALMKFVNCAIDENTYDQMRAKGAVEVTTTEGAVGPADVDYITCDLDQSATQVTKDDLYQAVVNICGMPNRNGTQGSSSDTGAAVLLRDGWSLAESHAKGYELEFKRSERDFLRVVLAICEQSGDVDLELRMRDIELAFNRRNYENLLVKVQALTTMLPDGFRIHPEVAFRHCGLFTDPETAYLQSAAFTADERERAEELAEQRAQEQGDPGPQAGSPQPQGENGADGAPSA